ncbi:integrin alpha-E [Amia ocellicauda]|uniref:integrin alpha-E n=1 Tax=Amia ocellicauda TaxID=2972642 RepID=UPI003463E960
MEIGYILWLIVMYKVDSFNIYTKPIKTFEQNKSTLFGQAVLQHERGVLVTSPNVRTDVAQKGELYDCTLKSNCMEISLAAREKTFTKAIVSAAGNADGSKYVVCQQHRTRKNISEDLNGVCTFFNSAFTSDSDFTPASRVVEQMKEANSNNNNNNKIQGQGTIADSSESAIHRSRRETTSKEDEEDEGGTEIAFVLDGSGSIEKPDFERAKIFMTKVMTMVWGMCTNCEFAIVQYGMDIRTELSLNESGNAQQALSKVQSIEQIYNYTKTASAINHVLEHIFVAENGSKPNTQKIIIVLTDGRIFLDPMNLTDVLNSPKMENIIRFAIGVGADFNNSKARSELEDIASDPDDKHLFMVDNYAALDGVLELLESSITGIEGMQGTAFHFDLSEAGFSTYFAHDGSVLFGAVGAYDWNGGLILRSPNDKIRFLNESLTEAKYSYLGYSVVAIHGGDGNVFVSGAPRRNLTGGVLVFGGESLSVQQILHGEQVGSYFGAVLCALDTEKNREADFLLIGAPFFHKRGEEGKVYVYRVGQGLFTKEAEWHGLGRYSFARFGSAIGIIGDIDSNGYNDVAVGAPLEDDSAGSVYIYNGYEKGIRKHFSQRLAAADVDTRLQFFGQSVSGHSDLDGDGQIDVSVGSLGKVTVFRSLPVIVFKPAVTVEPDVIPLSHQSGKTSSVMEIMSRICFNTVKGNIQEDEGALPIEYHMYLDTDEENKRLAFENSDSVSGIFNITSDAECLILPLLFVGCTDCFPSINIKFNFSLNYTSDGPSLRVLDKFSPKEVFVQLPFEKNCGSEKTCVPNVSLSTRLPQKRTLIVGTTENVSVGFALSNTGDDSYKTTLVLTYPNFLHYKKISLSTESEGTSCDNQMQGSFSQLTCKIRYPIFKKGAETNFSISWQMESDKKVELRTALINVTLTCMNHGLQVLAQEHFEFPIKHSLRVTILGKANPEYMNITEQTMGKKQLLNYGFEVKGENRYNAIINVIMSIPLTSGNATLSFKGLHQIFKQRETTFCTVLPSNGNRYIYFNCTLQDLEEAVSVEAEVSIYYITERYENIKSTVVLSFDHDLYEAEEGEIYTKEVLVTIEKLTMVKSMAVIIGSSIGGFLLLAFIICVLIKCGFFRRRYKDMRPE